MPNSRKQEEAIVKVSDLYYTYPDGIESLRGISFELYRGEKVALVGPNGAGKSTLLTTLIGIRIPRAGEVEIMNTVMTLKTRRELRRKVGLVFQDPDDQLFCPTVFDDVAFAPLNMGIDEKDIYEHVDAALKKVDLQGFEKRSSFHLSFGERKRVAFATVLAYSPEVLLIDEPSANLDPQHRRQVIKLLQALQQTMLIATHDLDLALELCERCLVINKGRIVAAGATGTILSDRELMETNGLELPLSLQKEF